MSTEEFLQGVEYPHPFDELVVALAESAARYLYILSPRLDHAAFDSPELVAALSTLARDSRQTEIRILIKDSRNIVAQGHRLLLLARKIPSAVKFRKLEDHPDWKGQTVVIRDRDGVLYKPGDADHTGFYEPASRASTRKHLELFEELWRHSLEDTELRNLSL